MTKVARNIVTESSPEIVESQSDAAYRLLRNWITTCRLAPGSNVHLSTILNETGFGRTPAREAFLRLEKDGLIETMPRSGYRIKPMTRKTITDFFTVWKVIAKLVFRLAAEKMTADDLAALRVVIAPLDEPSLTPAEHCKVRSDLFRAMTDRIDNAYVTRSCDQLQAEMQRIFFVFFTNNTSAEWVDSVDRVIGLLASEDKTAVERRVDIFIESAQRDILATMV